jgi:hypothetical protein
MDVHFHKGFGSNHQLSGGNDDWSCSITYLFILDSGEFDNAFGGWMLYVNLSENGITVLDWIGTRRWSLRYLPWDREAFWALLEGRGLMWLFMPLPKIFLKIFGKNVMLLSINKRGFTLAAWMLASWAFLPVYRFELVLITMTGVCMCS